MTTVSAYAPGHLRTTGKSFIPQRFDTCGFLIQDWDRVQTDWITLRPVGAEMAQVVAAEAN